MSTLAARLVINALADLQPAAPFAQDIGHRVEYANGWKQGTASGQVDRAYMVSGSLSASATDSYDLLAAGSLTDVLGQAIDADELKGFVLRCDTGTIECTGEATNPIGIFKAGGDGFNLSTGAIAAFSYGAAGIDVTTDSKFDITEAVGSTATYTLWLIVAQ